ncbi:MAG: hypothetical protein Q4C95_12855 [Planctomycetia bacterium]|nr:hypothetical protein [Planctomycetia bacterium]
MGVVPEPDIPDISWNFGRHKRKNFVFLKNGGIRYEHIIRERYADSPATLFLVADDALAMISRRNINQTIITFDEIFDFPADYRILLNDSRLEKILSDRTDWKPEQRRKRGTRLDNIEKATETLRIYAKSLLEAMDADGMSFDFPERPSQKWLAEKLNTNQSSVSRCLQDKNAVQLRFIWEALLSPDKLENIRPYLYKQF